MKIKYNKKLHSEFVKGAVLAAAIAEKIQDNNGYRLEDRILFELNIITKKQIRNYSQEEINSLINRYKEIIGK